MIEDLIDKLGLTEFSDQIVNSDYTVIEDGKLTQLDLGLCDAETLPDNAFTTCPDLELLNLSAMGLVQLPKNIFQPLTKLRILGLKSNNLEKIDPSYFSNNPNLEVVNLEFNPLASHFELDGVRVIY